MAVITDDFGTNFNNSSFSHANFAVDDENTCFAVTQLYDCDKSAIRHRAQWPAFKLERGENPDGNF